MINISFFIMCIKMKRKEGEKVEKQQRGKSNLLETDFEKYLDLKRWTWPELVRENGLGWNKAFLKYFFHIHDNLSLLDEGNAPYFRWSSCFGIYIPHIPRVLLSLEALKGWFSLSTTAISEPMLTCVMVMELSQRPGLTYKLERISYHCFKA